MNVALIDLFYANEEWAKLRRPGAVAFVHKRLSALSKSLGDKPYLDGERFTRGRPDDDDGAAHPSERLPRATSASRGTSSAARRDLPSSAAFDAQIGDFRKAA